MSEEAVGDGRSMRRTEAPYVARRRPQNGPVSVGKRSVVYYGK